MNSTRRSFLKAVGMLTCGGILGVEAAPAVVEEPKAEERKEERRMLCNVFSIAGFQYYDGPSRLPFMNEGDDLELRAAPDNPYDKYAVELYHNGRMIGFVPRTDNRHISRLLLQGAPLGSEIVSIAPDASPWRAVRASILLMI